MLFRAPLNVINTEVRGVANLRQSCLIPRIRSNCAPVNRVLFRALVCPRCSCTHVHALDRRQIFNARDLANSVGRKYGVSATRMNDTRNICCLKKKRIKKRNREIELKRMRGKLKPWRDSNHGPPHGRHPRLHIATTSR